MILTKAAFVGNFKLEGAPTDPKTALFHVDRLTSMNMLDWAKLSYNIISISLKIVTKEFNTIYIHKDCWNNLIVDGYGFLTEKVKSLSVEYVLPNKVKNTYDVQDIVASELVVYRYKVNKSNKNNVISLQAVIE